MNKKAAAVELIILIILVILVIWAFSASKRECRTDKNCGKEYYCGSDFKCHEKEVMVLEEKTSYGLLIPSAIIAVALIISALILRLKWEKKKKEPEHQQDFKYY